MPLVGFGFWVPPHPTLSLRERAFFGDGGEVLAEAGDDLGDGAGGEGVEAFGALVAFGGFGGLRRRSAGFGGLDFGADAGAGFCAGAGGGGADGPAFLQLGDEEDAAADGAGDAVDGDGRGGALAGGAGRVVADALADGAGDSEGGVHDLIEDFAVEFGIVLKAGIAVVLRGWGRETCFRLVWGGVGRHGAI